MAEIRTISADRDVPLTDTEIACAAVRVLLAEWVRSPLEADMDGMQRRHSRSRETITAWARAVARGWADVAE